MDEELQIAIESRIQELLSGQLGQTATAELLAMIGRDDDARRILAEMVALQRLGRRSFGYDLGGEVIPESLAATIDAMRTSAPPAFQPGRMRLHSLLGRIAWPMRIAALVVIAVSIYTAVMARHDSRLLRGQLARAEQVVTLPEPTIEELARLRRLWNQVSEGSGNSIPWVFLSNGTGQFAYLPANSSDADRKKLVLLRCVIVSSAGQSAMRMNLLLPARQAVRLAVPQAGMLADQPISVAVSATNKWAGLGLNVGSDSDGSTGVRGRVRIGGGAAEIGQFRLDGQKMKVFLQAMTLDKDVI